MRSRFRRRMRVDAGRDREPAERIRRPRIEGAAARGAARNVDRCQGPRTAARQTGRMYQRILVPIDGSTTARRGLAEAIRLAQRSGGRLRLLHVMDDVAYAIGVGSAKEYAGSVVPRMHGVADELLSKARGEAEAAGVEAEVAMRDGLNGAVCDIVAAEARQWPADIIVLGTHGLRGVKRLLMGSDAEGVLRIAPVPVLLVRECTEAPRH